jgi:hypothetical protein
MPGGKYDSSKTRVSPVFEALWRSGRDWLPRLLQLPSGGCRPLTAINGNLTLIEGYWEPNERSLRPPISLLSWLIRNIGSVSDGPFESVDRERLAAGDPEIVEKALRFLRSEGADRAWYIFEGPTSPDVFLVAPDVLVVIEGKRTELTATTETKWLPGRHQIWRHLDAAWEIRGRRSVYGFFIVESEVESAQPIVPKHWQIAAASCLEPQVLESSFPHRSKVEAQAIANGFLGATTWRHVCEAFGIDWRQLPHEVGGSVPKNALEPTARRR